LKPAAKIILTGLGFSLALSCAAPAFADGMPFREKKPEPVLTPLDKALDDIQNKQPPVDVTAKPAPEPIEQTPPPVAAAKPEEKLPPPVPESREVEVQPDSSFFGLSVGMYDPFTHGRQAASLNLQFEPGTKIAGVLQPLFGALVTTNGALMGYGGVGLPFHVGQHYLNTPTVAVGAYKRGDGVDLNPALTIRIGSEFAYEFDDKSRIGLNFHVLTNGTSLGRSDRTEVIGIAYTKPFNLLSGNNKKAVTDAPKPPLEK
jgi:lipid A 3-O-deacylase